ncbi:MAG: adenosylmethionine decarboxylase [Balneolaceae bacterium]
MNRMDSLGRQLLVEFYDCEKSKLNDVSYIEQALLQATRESRATVISHNFHKFSPYGVSGVIVIAESHVTIHTWPEYCYAAVDVFTCGDLIDPWVIQDRLKKSLQSGNVSSMEMRRGMFNVPEGKKLLFKPDSTLREN